MAEKADALKDRIAALCDKYVTPGDTEALAMVEGMINDVFIRAGVPPPSRIKLVFDSDNTIVIGFEDDMI